MTLLLAAPECLYASTIRKKAGDVSVIPLHRHEEHGELLLIVEGAAWYEIGNVAVSAKKGDLVFFPPGVWHRERSDATGPFAFHYVGYKGLRVEGCRPDCLLPPDRPNVIASKDRFPLLRERFERLIEECRSPSPERERASDAWLALLVVETLRLTRYRTNAERRLSAERTVRLAMRFIEERYPHPLALETIADAVHLSPFHLTRLFRETTDTAPIQYLIRCRMEAAMRLLSGTDDSVERIAEQVGYVSPGAFYRQFKKAVGTSPGDYRKKSM